MGSMIVQAQVSIGSDTSPQKGSLLELKTNDKKGKEANSDKGLGLPRVALSSPGTLTIDDEAKKEDYAGMMVYNITNNNDIKEGIYIWDGQIWKQTVSIDSSGTEGDVLQSNGDGTCSWSAFTFPEFSFHKPTQISIFDQNKATDLKLSYALMTRVSKGSNVYAPEAGLFDNRFVYSETLDIQSDESKNKYLLLGITALIRELTIGSGAPRVGFWQTVQIDVLVNDVLRKSYQKRYYTVANSTTHIYIDLFSIIYFTELGKGSYDLKIRISNLENTFPANRGSSTGYFSQNEQEFYQVSLEDINFILYEDD